MISDLSRISRVFHTRLSLRRRSMTPRMDNPSLVVPGALQPLLDLTKVIGKVGVPQSTLDLVRLRVSEINGRVYTLPEDPGAADADSRLPLVAGWRTESCFDDAE